jgi:hypothetical protein
MEVGSRRHIERAPHFGARKEIAVSAPANPNGAVREDLKDLAEDITAYFTGRKQVSAVARSNGALNGALEENLEALRKDNAELKGRLNQIQQDLASVKSESSRGFWRKLFRVAAKPPDDMERARERTRARIAYSLIGALVIVVAATFLYIATSATGDLAPGDVINVMQGLGTTLLAPLVGLIGAVIGFYYGGQTAVQGVRQAGEVATASQQQTQDATKAATEAVTKAVTQAQGGN